MLKTGTDLCDQMIAYYRPKIRCRRTWMPIMLHCLDVLQVNGFILYRECSKKHRSVVDKKSILDHKNFLKRLVHCLKRRAEIFLLANQEKKPAAVKNKSGSDSRKHVHSL